MSGVEAQCQALQLLWKPTGGNFNVFCQDTADQLWDTFANKILMRTLDVLPLAFSFTFSGHTHIQMTYNN